MQIKIIILVYVLLLSSCNSLPDSKGAYNELSIISSDEDREYVELFISNVFSDSIYTPILESSYKINYINPDDFINNKFNKNIIIVSLKYPPDSTIDLLSQKFLDKYNKPILSFYEMYAKNQLLLHINSHDYDDLIYKTSDYLNWIKNEINENIYKNIYYDYSKEKQSEEINNLISEKFSIELNMWIGRGYPYRWIVINKIKDNQISNFDNIKYLHETNLTSVIIPTRFKTEIKMDKNNVIRGLYEHLDSDTGGPFVTYVYEDIYKDYKLYVSGFVNNPGKDKIILLKQLESIFQKIKD